MCYYDMHSEVSLGVRQELEAELDWEGHSLQTLNMEKPSHGLVMVEELRGW